MSACKYVAAVRFPWHVGLPRPSTASVPTGDLSSGLARKCSAGAARPSEHRATAQALTSPVPNHLPSRGRGLHVELACEAACERLTNAPRTVSAGRPSRASSHQLRQLEVVRMVPHQLGTVLTEHIAAATPVTGVRCRDMSVPVHSQDASFTRMSQLNARWSLFTWPRSRPVQSQASTSAVQTKCRHAHGLGAAGGQTSTARRVSQNFAPQTSDFEACKRTRAAGPLCWTCTSVANPRLPRHLTPVDRGSRPSTQATLCRVKRASTCPRSSSTDAHPWMRELVRARDRPALWIPGSRR